MNNKPETSADIEAELRELSMSAKSASAKYGEYRPTVYGKPIALYFAKLADRIKAARKREKAAIEAEALAVGGMVEASRKRELSKIVSKNGADFGQLGDNAKMRDALKAVKRYFDGYTVNILELRRKVDAALAAPLRNCEVGTADEQAERFKFAKCDKLPKCRPWGECCLTCFAKWAQMPYEKGGAK